MKDLIGQTLGHYVIVEHLGGGGMGVVYKAEDTKLGRTVALKFLPPEWSRDPDARERFLREARAASALEDSRACTIFDIDETDDGQLFIAMAYYEGETLKKRLERGQLSIGRAVDIAIQTAEGLESAHSAEIIHRDIKPANLMLTGHDEVVIVDFGLAKLAGEQGLTQTGATVGTPHYMSPEQAKGAEVGPATDVWSLGVVLYEIVTGERPFLGDSGDAVVHSILHSRPKRLRDLRPEAPPMVERVVKRALEKDPAKRYESIGDLLTDLRALKATESETGLRTTTIDTAGGWRRRLVARLGLVFLVVFAIALTWVLSQQSHAPADPERLPRVVVLPFENLGPPEDEYFSDGMTDEVRGKLFRLTGVEVIARYSSDQYRGTNKPLSLIAEELGARYLLTAKVRWQKADEGSSRIRVSPELVQIQPGTAPVALWHDAFDANLADVFQVQADIATRVAHALDVTLSAEDLNLLHRRPTDNLAAYDAFLKAEQIDREGIGGGRAIQARMAELYGRAVALDPEFALAWARLSFVESTGYIMGGLSSKRAASARRAAERAYELDPLLPEAQLAMALYLRKVENDRQAAEQIGLPLEMAPNHPELGWRTSWSREEELAHLERAAVLDPLYWAAAEHVGIHQLYSRRYPEAEVWLDRAYSLAPTSLEVVWYRTALFLAQGDLEGARRFHRTAATLVDLTDLVAQTGIYFDLFWVLEDDWQELFLRLGPEPFGGDDGMRNLAFAHTHHLRAEREAMLANAEIARADLAQRLEDLPDEAQLHSYLGSALAYLGHEEEAVNHGRRGMELSQDSQTGQPHYYLQLQLVRIHIILGHPDPALDLLEPLLEVPCYLSPAWLRIDPLFDPLRDHPRFQALLEEYGGE